MDLDFAERTYLLVMVKDWRYSLEAMMNTSSMEKIWTKSLGMECTDGKWLKLMIPVGFCLGSLR